MRDFAKFHFIYIYNSQGNWKRMIHIFSLMCTWQVSDGIASQVAGFNSPNMHTPWRNRGPCKSVCLSVCLTVRLSVYSWLALIFLVAVVLLLIFLFKGYLLRRRLMAEPLLNENGIGSVIIESPFCILLSSEAHDNSGLAK